MSPDLVRRSSSGVRNLRQRFEGQNYISPASSPIPGTSSNGLDGRDSPAIRKVTASFVSVEGESSDMATEQQAGYTTINGGEAAADFGSSAPDSVQSNAELAEGVPSQIDGHSTSSLSSKAAVPQEPIVEDPTMNGSAPGQNEARTRNPETFVLPPLDKQSEHSEKLLSALEDEEAQLQPDITDQATVSGEPGASDLPSEENIETEERTQAESKVVRESHINGNVEFQKDVGNRNASEIKSESDGAQLRTFATARDSDEMSSKAPQRNAAPATTSKASFRPSTARLSNGKVSIPSSKDPKSVASPPTTKRVRKISTEPSNATRPNTSKHTLSKDSSSTRPARLSAHLTAPTAASSAKQESTAGPTGNASARTRRPINTSSHLLAPTAASAARQDQVKPSTISSTTSLPDRSVPSAKRDRTSIASTTNGTIRKPHPPSSSRHSIDPSTVPSVPRPHNGDMSKPPLKPSSRSAAGGESLLARMTRPTAASSGRAHGQAHEKPEPRNSLSQSTNDRPARLGTVRGKPGTAGAATMLRKSAVAGAAQQKIKNKTELNGQLSSNSLDGGVSLGTATNGASSGESVPRSKDANATAANEHESNGETSTPEPQIDDGDAATGADVAAWGIEGRLMETPDLRAGTIR